MDKKAKKARRREYTRQFYKGNHFLFCMGVLRMVILCGANLMISWLMQVLVDACTGGNSPWTMWELVMLCGICVLLLGLGYWLGYHAFPKFISRAMEQYKNYAFAKLSRKSIAAFSKENSSVYISALTNDANSIEVDYLCCIFNLLANVLLTAGALVMMLCFNPVLTAVGIALALLPAAASMLAGNRVAEAEKAVSEKNESYVSALKDTLSGFSVMKSFRAEEALCRLFEGQSKSVHDAKCVRRQVNTVVEGMGVVTGVIAQLGVFLVGIWMAASGKGISPGTVIAFINLMNFVVNPIGQVPQYIASWKAANALIDKLADALDSNVREEGDAIPGQLSDGIRVQDLTFGYEEEPVLQNVDFHFEAGKSYAIVGASGSGKSTLLNLLMAAHDSYNGSICYDGMELKSVSSESLYELVSMVQQNVFVFNASIRDNITMFREFPRDEVDRAIELSGLTALIEERGEAYLCGENGSGLSGGEKQRISIARSLLRKSSVLLVDEATASLDAQTAWQVSNSILHLDGLTRIVVTHALDEALLKQYDGILTLKAGRITETGSFAELMEQKGYFYSLYTVSQ